MNRASAPNSLGVKSRDKKGVAPTVIPWAKTVPVVNVATLFDEDRWRILALITERVIKRSCQCIIWELGRRPFYALKGGDLVADWQSSGDSQ